jgi:hypothetical protein
MAFTTLLRHLANLVSPGLIWLSAFLGFVRFHDYPVWRPEILLIGLALIALGFPFGLLIAIRAKTLGAAATTLLLLGWAAENLLTRYPDSFTTWDTVVQSVVGWGGSVSQYALLALGALLVFGLPFALFSLLGRNLGIALATVFGITAGTIVLLPSEKVVRGEIFSREIAANPDLPLVVHLVLDEYMGIEGLPPEIDGSQALRDELKTFYHEYGFEVFARAFSQYARTRNSLAAMLNAPPPADELLPGAKEQRRSQLRDNLWFRQLADQGYRIRTYYFDYIDFCPQQNGAIASCFVYSGNSIGGLLETDLPTLSAAKVIAGSYLQTITSFSVLGRHWLKELGWEDLLPKWLMTRSYLGAPFSLAVLSHIRQDLEQNPLGTAVFAHLLVPHHTYHYDRNCRIQENTDDWYHAVSRVDAKPELSMTNSPESRRRRYEAYFDQVGCLYRFLRDFLDHLKVAGLLQEATIIIHGDHGSRISLYSPNRESAERLSDVDLIDNYSVLYAIRRPGSKPAYNLNQRSSQALFAEMFLGQPFPSDNSAVVLDEWLKTERTADSRPLMQIPMPSFGACDWEEACRPRGMR